MNQLVKQFLVYGLGATIGKFLSVFLLPIYASVFTPDDYGYLDFIMTLSSVVTVFGLLQMETGLQRFYYDYEEENRNTLVSTAVVFTTILSICFTLLSFVFVPFLSKNYLAGGYQAELVVSLLTIVPTNIMTIIFVDFRFRNMAITYMIINVLMVLVSAVSSIVAVKVLNYGIMGVLLSNTAVHYVVSLSCIIVWLHKNKRLTFDKVQLKTMLSFGLPQFPARLGSLSNSYINRFFMMGMLSVYAIGIYSISLKIASVMQLVQMAFQLAWLPYMYKLLKQPNHKPIIIRYYKEIAFILSSVVLLIAFFSKEITLILTNEQYIEAARYAPLLAFYYCLYILKEVVDIGVNVTKKSKYTSYIFGVAVVVNIALLYFLTPIFQIYGVVGSLLASNFILLYLTMYVSERLYPMGFPALWSLLILLVTMFSIYFITILDMPLLLRGGISALIIFFLALKYKNQILSLFVSRR